MEGRDTGLPQDIADLFPDRLVESSLRDVPEGLGYRESFEAFRSCEGRKLQGQRPRSRRNTAAQPETPSMRAVDISTKASSFMRANTQIATLFARET